MLRRGGQARAPAALGSGGPAASISPAMSAEPARDEVLPDEPVTMDKIVSLAKRRGFVFQSSEIYGGIGSSYDYGHYGVLLKQNVKNAWQRAM